MGEYAKVKGTGAHVKIGTCEDMYYLRADQAHDVWPEDSSLDPVKEAEVLRFRFPWPDEDSQAPGDFEDPFRKLRVWGAEVPDIEHGTVQFKADNGYLVSLPCPEGELGKTFSDTFKVHRNGYGGAVHLVQQRLWNGLLVSVCECGGCGHKYRLETLEMAEPVIVGIRAEADRHQADYAKTAGDGCGRSVTAQWYDTIAERITRGYDPAYVASLRLGRVSVV